MKIEFATANEIFLNFPTKNFKARYKIGKNWYGLLVCSIKFFDIRSIVDKYLGELKFDLSQFQVCQAIRFEKIDKIILLPCKYCWCLKYSWCVSGWINSRFDVAWSRGTLLALPAGRPVGCSTHKIVAQKVAKRKEDWYYRRTCNTPGYWLQKPHGVWWDTKVPGKLLYDEVAKRMVPSGIEPLILALLAPRLNQLGQGTFREKFQFTVFSVLQVIYNFDTFAVRYYFYRWSCDCTSFHQARYSSKPSQSGLYIVILRDINEIIGLILYKFENEGVLRLNLLQMPLPMIVIYSSIL